MGVKPVTIKDPFFWKWADQRLGATLGTRPTRSKVMKRSGTSHIDHSLWENLTRVMGSRMGTMLQEQPIQQQPTATRIVQSERREFYSNSTLAALMGYAQVYTETGIPRILRNFQMSKECADKRQELLAGIVATGGSTSTWN